MIERRTDPAAHLAAFTFLHLMFHLGVRAVRVHQVAGECTRCGGSHPLSQCPWPTGGNTPRAHD